MKGSPFASRLSFPVPLLVSALTALGAAVSAAAHSWGLLGWAYADWSAASAQSRQALILAGPWVAGCCAWTAATFASPRSVIAPVASTRRGPQLVIAQLRVLIGGGALGYLAGLAPLWIWTLLGARDGHLDLLVVAGSLAALASFAALGYLAGTILPLAAAVPLAGGAAFAAAVISGVDGRASAPVWPFDVVAGLAAPPEVGAFRVLFFLTCAAGFAVAAGWWMRERALLSAPVALVGVVLAMLPLVLAASLGDRALPTTVRPDLDTEAACELVADVEVCVHPARVEMLPELIGVVDRLASAAGRVSGLLSEVDDATLWTDPAPGRVVLQLQGQDREGWRSTATDDLAEQIAGADECRSRLAGTELSGEAPGGVVVAEAVATWLARQAGSDGADIATSEASARAADELSSRALTVVRNYLADSLADVASCSADPADLP